MKERSSLTYHLLDFHTFPVNEITPTIVANKIGDVKLAKCQVMGRIVPSREGTEYTLSSAQCCSCEMEFKNQAFFPSSLQSGFVKVFSGLCYTIHSSPAAGDGYYVAAILLLDFDRTTKLLTGRAVYHSTRGNLKHLRKDLAANFEETRYVMLIFTLPVPFIYFK